MPTFEEKVMSRGNSRTIADERSSYRIKSQDYVSTSGSFNAVQIKPNISVGGTTGITGLEVAPRIADGKTGSGVVGIKADPALKGESGNITGGVVAVECNIDLGDDTSTRTIGGDIAAFSTFLSLPSGCVTSAGLNTVMKVRTVNIAKWDGFLNIDDLNTGVTRTDALSSGTSQYLKVYIGTTEYTILMTSST